MAALSEAWAPLCRCLRHANGRLFARLEALEVLTAGLPLRVQALQRQWYEHSAGGRPLERERSPCRSSWRALSSSEVGPAVLVFAPRQLQVSVMPESVSSARGASQGVHSACGLEHSAHAELWGCPHLTCGRRGLALLAGWCSAAPNGRRLAGASQLAVLNTQSPRDPGVPPSHAWLPRPGLQLP